MKQYNCRSDCTRFREAFDEGPSSRALYSIVRCFVLRRILISKIFALIVQCHASLSTQKTRPFPPRKVNDPKCGLQCPHSAMLTILIAWIDQTLTLLSVSSQYSKIRKEDSWLRPSHANSLADEEVLVTGYRLSGSL